MVRRFKRLTSEPRVHFMVCRRLSPLAATASCRPNPSIGAPPGSRISTATDPSVASALTTSRSPDIRIGLVVKTPFPASTDTKPLGHAPLGVRRADSALASALGEQPSLTSVRRRSNGPDIVGLRRSSPHSSREDGYRIQMDKKTTETTLNKPIIVSLMRNCG